MIRKFLKTLVVALAAVATFATMAEAAPRKVVRHRARHSTRVSSGATVKTRKKVVHRRVRHSTKRKATPSTKPR